MIPNIITLMNLFSGCIGVVFVFTSDPRLASLMIFISLLLDYMDGGAARLLNVKSELGKELDSLADLISFGLLPSLIAYIILRTGDYPSLAYIAFLMTVMSAYRLAKFNLDERQSENFIGLPTPANAIFWSAFPLVIYGDPNSVVEISMASLMVESRVIMILIVVFSYLLIAEIPLFSLKFSDLRWKNNAYRFVFLIMSVILFVLMSYYALPFIILLYLLISILKNKFAQHEI